MEFTPASYDVLINFTGEDIRRKFVSHLDSALSTAGLTTFFHEENIVKAMQLQDLTQPKELCRVAIVVFTKTYAESAWCLHELQEIIKWQEIYCRHVLPVYYEIHPSDVRLQKGNFGKALKATAQQTFSGQQVEDALSRWSRALTKAANLFGWDESNYRSDAGLVEKIVKSVLNLPVLAATKFPVGLQYHAENLIRYIKNNNVSIIGIWGMEGVGKTTIVKAVYNQIHSTFMYKSFIEDVEEICGRGHFQFEKQLLSDVLKTKVEIKSREIGASMIQKRLSGRRMLIVLDGANQFQRLKFLCENRKWCGDGTVVLGWLKFLNLSHSKYLTETPDFSGLPSLKKLILKDCPSLSKVHQSIGDLCNLLLINLKDCTSLSNLPKEVYKLKSLKTLILSGCLKIDILEEDVAQMESLITLITEYKAVKQVPFSIVSSKCIGYVSLRGFEGLSHNIYPSIIRSWISPTMNHLSYIRPCCMDLDNNNWGDLKPMLSSLANLRSVLVQCDTEFQLSKQVKAILVEYGVHFTELRISNHLLRFSLIGVGCYNEFFNTLSESISEGLARSESSYVCLPGDNHPHWLAHVGGRHSVHFTVPKDCDLKGMVLCVVYLSTPENMATECLASVLIVNYTKCTFHIHKHGTTISFNDIDWEGIISNLKSGDKVEIFVTLAHGLVVKNTAVYLIYGESKKNTLHKFIKKKFDV
ncbi:unnamed protein product [Sphenostylis stenocarpa]|uniref:TIR domain-containing protein n=1 Tax=Sphenostylis stenocarpa TaxID=92480 RepID=A0AA86SQT0_9FABA|nr:unnamed protein product [Sphenostylis stenocarpa]